jgi:probable rRNA maturation factor
MVEIINSQRRHPLRPTRIRTLIERLAARYRLGNPEVAVAFVGTRRMRTLNRSFRKKDRPTDVLSFPLGTTGPDGKSYLGDIVVCMPVAARQAVSQGHGLDREIDILVVHGFLHLAGFDHGASISPEERKVRRLLFGEDFS